MEKMNYGVKSLLLAAATFLYIAGIVFLINNAQAIFGPEETMIIPLFMLLLFVVSAAVTGLLVFGKPVLLYLTGKTREAFTLLFGTLGWLALFLLFLASLMAIV
jgi:hypothetical protein